jgi:hypothetical protein
MSSLPLEEHYVNFEVLTAVTMRTAFFIVTAVRTSNLAHLYLLAMLSVRVRILTN